MHKFPITEFQRFDQLPLQTFNTFKYSVYILDFAWKYLFLNDYSIANLGQRGEDLLGKEIWVVFPELARDSAFQKMKSDMERGVISNFTTMSPVTGKRLHVVGYGLEDCYYFSATVLPDKDDLLNELRSQLNKS